MTDQECEVGFVKSVFDDKAVVSLSQTDVCKSCNARLLCRPNSSGKREVTALNSVNAEPGQKVRIEESGHFLLKMSFMQFGLPLIFLLSGILIADGFKLAFFNTPPEVAMSVYGFLGLLIGAFISRAWARKKAGSTSYVFEITSVIEQR